MAYLYLSNRNYGNNGTVTILGIYFSQQFNTNLQILGFVMCTVSLERSDGQRNKVPAKQQLKASQSSFSPSSLPLTSLSFPQIIWFGDF